MRICGAQPVYLCLVDMRLQLHSSSIATATVCPHTRHAKPGIISSSRIIQHVRYGHVDHQRHMCEVVGCEAGDTDEKSLPTTHFRTPNLHTKITMHVCCTFNALWLYSLLQLLLLFLYLLSAAQTQEDATFDTFSHNGRPKRTAWRFAYICFVPNG